MQSNNDYELLLTIVVAALAVGALAAKLPDILGALGTKLLNIGILTTTNVIVPISGDMGLDVARLVIGIGLAVIGIVAGVSAVRSHIGSAATRSAKAKMPRR